MKSKDMKAMVFTEYGGPRVIHQEMRPIPVPRAGELLVNVSATTVNYGDMLARRLGEVTLDEFNMPAIFLLMARFFFGFRRPRVNILGSEFAGTVVACADDATGYQPGDKVFGYTGQQMGAYAEYLCVAAKGPVAKVPEGFSMEEAASLAYGPLMAVHLIQKVGIEVRQRILVLGAGGSIGSAMVQLASQKGALVTAVCSSRKTEWMEKMGAEKVVDYHAEDWHLSMGPFDLILDVTGKTSFRDIRRMLSPHGTYLAASFNLKRIMQSFFAGLFSKRRYRCVLAPGNRADFLSVQELMAKGQLTTYLDRIFHFEKAADAHRYVELQEEKGKVVIAVQA